MGLGFALLADVLGVVFVYLDGFEDAQSLRGWLHGWEQERSAYGLARRIG